MTAETGTEYAWGPSFMNYLGGGADASFEDIQNDIAYAVSTGSYVIVLWATMNWTEKHMTLTL